LECGFDAAAAETAVEKGTNLLSGQEAAGGRVDGTMSLRKLSPTQLLERLLIRLKKRTEALQRLKLDGYGMVISELETEMDYLRRAKRYMGD
jgi:phage FluMu protein gp41